jgi:NTE family protein
MKALVLSGGGSKGAWQAGVVKYLLQEERPVYDVICGISVGALNAVQMAMVPKGFPALTADRLSLLWETVSTDKVWKRWFPFGKLHALWKSSVYNSSPLQQFVRSRLDPIAVKSSGNQLRIVAVSWHTGEVAVANEQSPNLSEWVLASSAFPVFLTPISINNDLWTDGGLRSVTPLGEAIRAGADDIDVVMCSDPFAQSLFDISDVKAIPGLALRAIDVMNDQVSRADLQICGLKNDLAQLPGSKYKSVKVRIFTPQKPLAYDSLDFTPENLQAMFKQGSEDAHIFQQM